MAVTKGGMQVDPDALNYEIAYTGTVELFVDYTNKKLRLVRVGNLTADGVTMKCVYSKLKELWKSDATLIKYPFPMVPITDEQFELVNGWDFDKNPVTTTQISVASCTGTNATFIITTSASFATSKIVPGMYLSGTNVGAGARVVSVDSATQITVTVANSGSVSGSLTFWTDSDYTYNLIRTGGWALKDTNGTSQEEWAGVISLGNLGAQGAAMTLTSGATTSASTTLTVASTTGVVAGSYLIAPGIPMGTTVASITNATTIVMSQAASATATGLTVSVRPKDQVYYQTSASGSAVNFALAGPVNQAVQVYGDATHGNFDNRSYMKIFVREQSYTYGTSKLADIGVSTVTYQVYRFPLSNAQDLKITHADHAIYNTKTVATCSGTSGQATITTTGNFNTASVQAGDLVTGTGVGAGARVVSVDSNTQITVSVNNSGSVSGTLTFTGSTPYNRMTITWYAAPQNRTIGGSGYNFHVIIDADTSLAQGVSGSATAEQIYEFVQYQLRQTSDIDAGAGTKTGKVTRDLLRFVGDTLYTIYDSGDGGVYIDNFSSSDTNRIVFADSTGTNRTFPYTAAGSIAFNQYLVSDGVNSKYAVFFSQLQGGKKFGSNTAVIVKKADNSTDITGSVPGVTVNFDFDYDGNTQAAWAATTTYVAGDQFRYGTTWYQVNTGYTSGGSFGATDTSNSSPIGGPSVTVVAIGLNSAQYVSASGTIGRSISNSFSLVSALERNYSNPV